MDADGDNLTRITNNDAPVDWEPAWSPGRDPRIAIWISPPPATASASLEIYAIRIK